MITTQRPHSINLLSVEKVARRRLAIPLILALCACTTGEKVADISEGMSPSQVTAELGKPDGFERNGDFMVYRYTNRLTSGWSWDKADYAVVFKDDRVVQYGAGEVRPSSGPNAGYVIVFPPRDRF